MGERACLRAALAVAVVLGFGLGAERAAAFEAGVATAFGGGERTTVAVATSSHGWIQVRRAPSPEWHSIGGASDAGPALARRADGTTDVFYMTAAGYYWHSSIRGTRQSAWESLGGPFASPPAAAVRNTTGEVDVVGRTSDGRLWLMSFRQGSGWSPRWTNLGVRASSRPALASGSSGEMHVFAVGTDGNVGQTWTTDGVTWAGWQSLGSPSNGTMTAISTAAGTYDVFSLDPSDQGTHLRWDGTAWSQVSFPGIAAATSLAALPSGSGDLTLLATRRGRLLTLQRTGGAWGNWDLGETYSFVNSFTLGYSSVDAERQIDYAYTAPSAYGYAVDWGANIWNLWFRSVTFVDNGSFAGEGALPADVDVGIEDYYDTTTIDRAYYQPVNNGPARVRFNAYMLNQPYPQSSYDMVRGTGAHEFGHALGIDHSWVSTDLMGIPATPERCIMPCGLELDVYEYLWSPLPTDLVGLFARGGSTTAPVSPAKRSPGVSIVETDPAFDPADNAALRAFAAHVFTGQVVRSDGVETAVWVRAANGRLVRSRNGLPRTRFVVEVDRQFKGEVPRLTIVSQTGGVDPRSGDEVVVGGQTPIKVGRNYLFYTRTDPLTGAERVVAPSHAAVEVSETRRAQSSATGAVTRPR